MPQPPKILLIEDDHLQFRMTEQMLATVHRQHFELDWAQTFDEGLRLLVGGNYAGALLDFRLGDHNGLELLREARAQKCDTPVIFLTGDSSERVDEAAMEAGASDYLIKGEITSRMLERSIRYSLKLGNAMRELHRLAKRDALTGLCRMISLTMSAGVAGLPMYGEQETDLLTHADQALYAAKRAGRDRAVLASQA